VAANWDLTDDSAVSEYLTRFQCLSTQLESILSSFGALDLASLNPESSSTSQIRSWADEILQVETWSRRALVTDDFPSGVSPANYEVDYQKRFACDSCHQPHQISIELGFDNRQAVGTNLLKIDLASQSFHKKYGSASIGIIVVTNTIGRQRGRWDGAVAIDYDYSWARRKAYASYLDTPILLLTLS
jgi:hypothetical protein